MGHGPSPRRAASVLLLVTTAAACGLSVVASDGVEDGDPLPEASTGANDGAGGGGASDGGDASDTADEPCEAGTVRACTPVDAQCSEGTQKCEDGVFGPCIPRSPTAETCNGIDDDCNGTVDDPCPTGVTLGEPTHRSPMLGSDVLLGEFDDTCPAGEALVGVTVETVSHLRSIRGRCGKVEIQEDASSIPYAYTLRVITPGTILEKRGLGSPLAESTAMCPADSVVTGISGRHAGAVDQIVLHCSPLSLKADAAPDAGPSLALTFGASVPTNAVGGSGGNPFSQWDCPAGTMVHRMSGKALASVDNVTFHCATPSITTKRVP